MSIPRSRIPPPRSLTRPPESSSGRRSPPTGLRRLRDPPRRRSRSASKIQRTHSRSRRRNRHHRSRSIPYERNVDGAESAACNSAKYPTTGTTTAPSASSSDCGRCHFRHYHVRLTVRSVTKQQEIDIPDYFVGTNDNYTACGWATCPDWIPPVAVTLRRSNGRNMALAGPDIDSRVLFPELRHPASRLFVHQNHGPGPPSPAAYRIRPATARLTEYALPEAGILRAPAGPRYGQLTVAGTGGPQR